MVYHNSLDYSYTVPNEHFSLQGTNQSRKFLVLWRMSLRLASFQQRGRCSLELQYRRHYMKYIAKFKENSSRKELLMFLSNEGPTLETLDYIIRIGSTPTFLYFDLYLYSAYAAHYVHTTTQMAERRLHKY